MRLKVTTLSATGAFARNKIFFAIKTLFKNGEQGAWYDPSDLPTLFQDTAGTTPVTAVEQAVALMLDKSGRGNHASQATSAKRPRYSRLVNLLTKTEQFSDAVWAKNSGTTVSDRKVISGAGNGYQGINCTVAVAVGSEYITKCKAKAAEYTRVTISDGAFSSFAVTFNLTTGAVTETRGAGFVSASILDAGAGEFEISVRTTFVQSTYYARFSGNPGNTAFAAGAYFTGDGVSGVEVWDVGVTLATDAHLPYQWVNTATDYDADPSKFPAYLRFDGADDALQTGNIDFTGTDKMTVWAGVTKLSDAAVSVVAELGSTLPPGGFYVAAPNSVGPTFGFASKGTVPASPTPSGHAAPKNAVLAGIGDIAGDIASLRVNGVATTASTDQGTGNYGNLPLYIGARAGTSLFFNGRIYQLIVRGAQSSLSQIEAAALYTRRRMMLP